MTHFVATHIQFAMRGPSESIDHTTALAYGLLTASADLPDQSIIPLALDSTGVRISLPSLDGLRARLQRVDREWSYSLQDMHSAPIFRSLQPDFTGGEIVLYETEVPAAAGLKVFAFIGLWRGDHDLLETLANRRFSVRLSALGECFSATLNPGTADPHTFVRGDVPSEVLRAPIWDSEVGCVALRSLETLPDWRVRVALNVRALAGEPQERPSEYQFRDSEFMAYLRELNQRVPDLLPLSWHTLEQYNQFKTAHAQAFAHTMGLSD